MEYKKYKLSECCTIIAGQSPESKYYNTDGEGLPFFQGKADFGEVYPTIRVFCSKPVKIAEKDDILLSVRAPVGPTNLAPGKVCIGRGLTAIRPSNNLLTKYLLLYLKRFEIELANQGTGTTFKAITQSVIKNMDIYIPSIHDQERIVTQIEESLSQLDSAVETLKKTKQQLEIYRQAVLKEAFDSVKIKTKVSSFCDVVRGGSPRPAGDKKYYDGSIPFLKVADLTKNKGLFLKKYSYTIKEAGLKKTRMVSANTLLLTNSGATLGVPKICTFETTFNDGIAAFLFYNADNEYLPYHCYFWESKTIELRAINQGAAQPNLNTSIISDYAFPHCDYHTQKRIAQKIEKQISICNNIEETVNQSLQQAEALRQSILKQAFGGEN